MAYRTSDNMFPSLSPISVDRIIMLCKEKLRFIEKQKQEEIDYLILRYMEPRKFLFWTRKLSREQAIEAINERKMIGNIEINSPQDDIEYKWLNKSVQIENILKLANMAKEHREEKILINSSWWLLPTLNIV